MFIDDPIIEKDIEEPVDALYAVHAYDIFYNGLSGMQTYAVIEASDDKDAEDVAYEMSKDVIRNYDIPNKADWQWDNQDELEDMIFDDINYEVWKLTDKTNKTLTELNIDFKENPDEFIKRYSIEQIA